MEMEPCAYDDLRLVEAKRLKRGPPESFTKDEVDAAEALIMLYEESRGHRRSTFFAAAAAAKRVKMSTSNSASSSVVEEAKNSTSAASDEKSSPNSSSPPQQLAYKIDDSFQSNMIVIRCVNLQTTTALDDGEPKKSASSAAESHANNGDTISVTVKNHAELSSTLLLTASNGRHICSICGRIFQSHQALGGHKTLHRLKPQNAAVSNDGGRRNSAAIDGRVHECSVCHERFQCGQALGGHMRKHYGGSPLLRNKKAAAKPPARALLDLNHPPAPEE